MVSGTILVSVKSMMMVSLWMLIKAKQRSRVMVYPPYFFLGHSSEKKIHFLGQIKWMYGCIVVHSRHDVKQKEMLVKYLSATPNYSKSSMEERIWGIPSSDAAHGPTERPQPHLSSWLAQLPCGSLPGIQPALSFSSRSSLLLSAKILHISP